MAWTSNRPLIAYRSTIAHPAQEGADSLSGAYRRTVGDVSPIPCRCFPPRASPPPSLPLRPEEAEHRPLAPGRHVPRPPTY
eukprot:2818920-Pyramimonas_sp.AAC.1